MKKETVTKVAPTTKSSGDTPTSFDQQMYQRNLFLVLLLNMTWQLAIVVLIPVIGGAELDKHYHATPLWIIVGGIIALFGVAGVLKNILSVANRRANYQAMAHGGKK